MFAGGSAVLIMLAGLADYATSPAYADPAPSGLSAHHMDTLPIPPSSGQDTTVTVRFRYDDAAPASGRGFVATIGEGASFDPHSWSMREPVDNTPIGECSTSDFKTLVCSEDSRADGDDSSAARRSAIRPTVRAPVWPAEWHRGPRKACPRR